jgi:nuclear transport factor 2 (NTF2) superfamily protein
MFNMYIVYAEGSESEAVDIMAMSRDAAVLSWARQKGIPITDLKLVSGVWYYKGNKVIVRFKYAI